MGECGRMDQSGGCLGKRAVFGDHELSVGGRNVMGYTDYAEVHFLANRIGGLTI